MQEALGELFDQRNDMMAEHALSQRTNMKAMHCQELACLLGVLVCLFTIPLRWRHLRMLANCKITLCPEKLKKGAN